MRLVVGLGNPGSKHVLNRHNIGFLAIDAIAGRHRFQPFRQRFQSETAEGALAGDKVLLLKPMTYMNESGRAVAAAAGFYRLQPADVIVFHDELDLAPGRLRVKTGGGHAGHNGLRSLHDHLGADFTRVRMGIGHPGDRDRVTGYVLQDFAKADMPWVDAMVNAIADAFALLLEGNEGEFMNRVSRAVQPVLPSPPPPAQEPGNGI